MTIKQEVLARRPVLELVKDKQARFERLSSEMLHYVTDDGFKFTVPLEETKGGVFKAEHRAVELMRWIRQQKAAVTAGGTLVEE